MKLTIMSCILSCMSCLVYAAEPTTNESEQNDGTVLARVNGEAITRRQLEDAIMRQEGVQLIEDLLRMQLETIQWDKINDDDIIVKVANIEIPRVVLASRLLDKHGADVREQMIRERIVKQTLIKEKLELNDALKDDILQRMRRKHRYDQEENAMAVVPFETMIQEKYGKSVEQWVEDPAFLTLAGLYALLYKMTEVPDDELRAYFSEHVRRYAKPEAYELAVMPFHLKDREGNDFEIATQMNIKKNAENTYKTIKSGRRSFEKMVRFRDKQFKGERGFVTRDGRTEVQGVARVPREVMEAVFRHDYDEFPVVLGVIESPDALSIVEVRGYRKGEVPDFEASQEMVKRDVIDGNFDLYMRKLLKQLNADSEIDYPAEGMIPVLQQRRADMQDWVKRRQEAHKQQAEGEKAPK